MTPKQEELLQKEEEIQTRATKQGKLEREVWLEEDLASLLGIRKYHLRDIAAANKLPYIRLSKTHRLYLDSTVYDWLKTMERIID